MDLKLLVAIGYHCPFADPADLVDDPLKERLLHRQKLSEPI